MVAPAHTYSIADDIGLAVMGVRGLHDLGQIIEDDEESEEEKREREARNAGSAIGAVVGIAAGLALGIDDNTEDIDEDDEWSLKVNGRGDEIEYVPGEWVHEFYNKNENFKKSETCCSRPHLCQPPTTEVRGLEPRG
jgi:hypothetical protein